MSELSGARRKRRDAAENRERILDHAEQLFEIHGLETGFHRIANDLGIGVGTVYRHFPDRDALFLSLYERYHQRIEELGETMLTRPEGMPRVLAFIDSTIAFSARRPVARRVSARVRQAHPDQVRSSRWEPEISAAVRQAKEAGDLRDDVEVTDVAVLAGMLADLATIDEPRRSILLPRMRALTMDALRPVGQARPGLGTVALSVEDLTALAHQSGRG
ncbi:TetR/AcrR family transcriptional regulator [Paramicrobacterium fandaimingii]|uniref:TetR/AcrR family transcriptional regulator n=1 Tax=Paramicrobacterium fandaimingii TaxID=2708079 RepID=UPI00142342C1|nr:TetR/AcrR family transcriptional regulator [Microbacterium fandaimingii]